MSVWPFSFALLPCITVESLAPSRQLVPCRHCKILPKPSVLQTIPVPSACPLREYSVPDYLVDHSLNTLSILKSFLNCGAQNWTQNADADEQVLNKEKSWVILMSRSTGSSSGAELVCCLSCCAQLYLPAHQDPLLPQESWYPAGHCPACASAGLYSPVQGVCSWVSVLPILAILGPLWMAIPSCSILTVSSSLVLATNVKRLHPSSSVMMSIALPCNSREKKWDSGSHGPMVWAYLRLKMSINSRQAWISVKVFVNVPIYWLYSYNLNYIFLFWSNWVHKKYFKLFFSFGDRVRK